MSHPIQKRMAVYHQSFLTLNELVDSFSVSDSCSDSREEVYMQRFWNNSAHGPTDQAEKSRNTYK